ncbi:antibiotic ABC transporter (plasmid) [Roseobacteraceae bacterium NS-SX3]
MYWSIPAQMRFASGMVRMAFEAQAVIALRTLGVMGMLPAAPGENTRMVAEKVKAFQTSANRAAQLAAAGQPAQAVLAGALAPYSRATASNYKRLIRRRKSRG